MVSPEAGGSLLMSTEEEIKGLVRNNLPLLFGEEDDWSFPAEGAVADHSAALSAPVLSDETIRYQSMLLYVSALFLAVTAFKIREIKLGDNPILVDRSLLIIYAIFIAVVILIFCIKVSLDYQRASFIATKSDLELWKFEKSRKAQFDIQSIQSYFTQELSAAISCSYEVYQNALRKAGNEPPDHTQVPARPLSLENVPRNVDTRTEIARLNTYLQRPFVELAADENYFQKEVEGILGVPGRAQSEDLVKTKEKIDAACDQHLRKWFNARAQLAHERLDASLKSKQDKWEALLRLAERRRTIQSRYRNLEVVAPIIFAIGAIVYVGCVSYSSRSNASGPSSQDAHYLALIRK